MVDLVQEAAGDDILALIFVPVAVPVLCTDDNVLGTGDDAVFAGQAQTALHAGLRFLADLDDLGVHKLYVFLAGIDDAEPAHHADLRPSKAHAVRVVHRLDHVLDQNRKPLVKPCDRTADLRQNGVAHRHDLSQCHSILCSFS